MAINREAVVRSAEKYVSKGKVDAAIREYRKVLAENPNDINTLNRVGDLYARISRIDEAVKLFVQIAEQYATDGFFVKAIAIYKKIIKLDPTRLEIYERLADLYAKQGLKTEARTQYQVLADYYLKHNQAASAITIHLRMADLEPDNPSHHLKLAELYQSQQLWDKAIREYRAIAEMMLERGAVEEATQVYLRAIDVKSDDLAFITDVVMGLKEAGHSGAAAKLLAAAVQRNPQAERIARLAGFGGGREAAAGHDQGDDTVAVGGRVPTLTPPTRAPAQRVVPPPALDDAEFMVEIDDDVPSTLVQPPADMGDRPGFGFRSRGAEPTAEGPIESAERLEPEEPAALGSSSLEATPELELELEIDEDVIELDLGEIADVAELEDERAPAESAALPREEPEVAFELEMGEAPELPDLGEMSFDLADDEQAEAAELADETPAALATEAQQAAPASISPDIGEVDEESFELELDGVDELALEDATPEPAVEAEPTLEVEPDLEVDQELEPLELPELAGQQSPSAPWAADQPPSPAAETVAPEPELPLPAVEPAAVVVSHTDLLAEAEVFAKYGLEEKALDRIAQIVSTEPEHLAARCLEVEVLLKLRDEVRLVGAVERTAELAARLGDTELWPKLTQRLEKAGYSVAGGRVAATPPAQPKKPDRISQLLGDLGLAGGTPRARRAVTTESSVDALLGDLAVTRRPASRPAAPELLAAVPDLVGAEASAGVVEPVEAAPEAGAVAPEMAGELVDAPAEVSEQAASAPGAAMAEELAAEQGFDEDQAMVAPTFADPTLPLPRYDEAAFDEELPDIVLPERRSAAPAPVPVQPLQRKSPKPAVAAESDGLDWLDEPGTGTAGGGALFDEEDEFFDLAAELEQELDRDDVLRATGAETPEEPSLEEIVEGFKKGVAEHLSEEDYDTHYNLGIAYREMGLLDEAIGEFQLSAKSVEHFVDSCAMLGLCFLEKGLPDLGVKWYRRALESPDNSEETTLGLLYDLGSVYLSTGDEESAYKTFVEIYGINSNYRDIVARIDELRP